MGKALYFPAIVAGQHNPVVRALCERFNAEGKPVKIIVCAAMRKLLALAWGVLRGRPHGAAPTGIAITDTIQ